MSADGGNQRPERHLVERCREAIIVERHTDTCARARRALAWAARFAALSAALPIALLIHAGEGSASSEPRRGSERLLGPPQAMPTPRPAIEAIVDAFTTHQLVALGEIHGSIEQHRLIRQLLRDRRFQQVVDDIVVEFGSARYQATIDRYLRGERVPWSRVRRAWSLTTQTTGVWDSPVYPTFFRTVREINRHLPAKERIRVLLADPPIDWSKIDQSRCRSRDTDWQRPHCLDYWLHRRESHAAAIIRRNVLARAHSALLIAGNTHFRRTRLPLPQDVQPGLITLVEGTRTGLIHIIHPYVGFTLPQPAIEAEIRSWPPNSIASVAGTIIGDLDLEVLYGPPQPSRPGQPRRPDPYNIGRVEDQFDALLFLTSRVALIRVPSGTARALVPLRSAAS